jgi:hypothetical protein
MFASRWLIGVLTLCGRYIGQKTKLILQPACQSEERLPFLVDKTQPLQDLGMAAGAPDGSGGLKPGAVLTISARAAL